MTSKPPPERRGREKAGISDGGKRNGDWLNSEEKLSSSRPESQAQKRNRFPQSFSGFPEDADALYKVRAHNSTIKAKEILVGKQRLHKDQDNNCVQLNFKRNNKALPSEKCEGCNSVLSDKESLCTECCRPIDRLRSLSTYAKNRTLITPRLKFTNLNEINLKPPNDHPPFVLGIIGPKNSGKTTIITHLLSSPDVMPQKIKLETFGVELYMTPDNLVFLNTQSIDLESCKQESLFSYNEGTNEKIAQNIDPVQFILLVSSVVIVVVEYSDLKQKKDVILNFLERSLHLNNSTQHFKRETYLNLIPKSGETNTPKIVLVQTKTPAHLVVPAEYAKLSCLFANSLNNSPLLLGSAYNMSSIDASYSGLIYLKNDDWVCTDNVEGSIKSTGKCASYDNGIKNSKLSNISLSQIANLIPKTKICRSSQEKSTKPHKSSGRYSNLDSISINSSESFNLSYALQDDSICRKEKSEEPNVILLPEIFYNDSQNYANPIYNISNEYYKIMLYFRNNIVISRSHRFNSFESWLNYAKFIWDKLKDNRI